MAPSSHKKKPAVPPGTPGAGERIRLVVVEPPKRTKWYLWTAAVLVVMLAAWATVHFLELEKPNTGPSVAETSTRTASPAAASTTGQEEEKKSTRWWPYVAAAGLVMLAVVASHLMTAKAQIIVREMGIALPVISFISVGSMFLLLGYQSDVMLLKEAGWVVLSAALVYSRFFGHIDNRLIEQNTKRTEEFTRGKEEVENFFTYFHTETPEKKAELRELVNDMKTGTAQEKRLAATAIANYSGSKVSEREEPEGVMRGFLDRLYSTFVNKKPEGVMRVFDDYYNASIIDRFTSFFVRDSQKLTSKERRGFDQWVKSVQI